MVIEAYHNGGGKKNACSDSDDSVWLIDVVGQIDGWQGWQIWQIHGCCERSLHDCIKTIWLSIDWLIAKGERVIR